MMARKLKLETDAGTEYTVHPDVLLGSRPEARIVIFTRKADGASVTDSLTAGEAEVLAHFLRALARRGEHS